jgi:hypothetical protein
LSYEDGGTLAWNLFANDATAANRGITFDGVVITNGSLSIASGAELDLIFNGAGSTVVWSNSFWDENRAWTIIAPAGTTTISPADGSFTLDNIGVDSVGEALLESRGAFFFGGDDHQRGGAALHSGAGASGDVVRQLARAAAEWLHGREQRAVDGAEVFHHGVGLCGV